MTIRFGLIGCGRVAPRHAQSIQQMHSATLAAVADIKINRAQNFAAEYGAEPYADYRALLEDPE